ncbi:MAG: hypothetical protein KGJ80_15095 [Chloroflexota bacterium]|nr:hypothetical protein [Chloroflexota bacterium]
MRLLIDTNIFLEVILEQSKASEARALLTKMEEHEFCNPKIHPKLKE